MRARNIKPAFFKNSKLGKLDPYARLFFIGLWCASDFNGNIELDEDRLWIEILPYDRKIDINSVITSLCKSGHLIKYSVDDVEYLHIPTFREHQNPHPHEVKKGTKNPEYSIESEVTTCNYKKLQDTTNNAESLILNPDILNPDILNPESCNTSKTSQTKKQVIEDQFKRFWMAYPRKVGKQTAFKAFNKLKPTEELLTTIINHIEERKVSDEQWIKDDGSFVPHGATFINNKRWEDEYKITKTNNQESKNLTSEADNMLAELQKEIKCNQK